MPGPTDRTSSVDLAAVLAALASPVRIDLLRLLRVPHALGAIRLFPHRAEGGKVPERPMSVTNVRRHMEALGSLGIVRARRALRDGRAVEEYQVNRPQLFAAYEGLRELAESPGTDLLDGTLVGPPGQAAAPPRGAHLALVRGLGEGRAFGLSGPGPWTVGRDAQCDVPLEYDGFVSLRNSHILRGGEAFALEDVPGNRNGTWLNWSRLRPGDRATLRAGDVVGVGRSLLVFRQ